MDAAMEERLAGLIAKSAIHEVQMRYCRGADRLDAELMASCFHDDAVDDHGTFVAHGADGIAEAIVERQRGNASVASMHLVGNELIELLAPNRALVESYFVAMAHEVRDGVDLTRFRVARYVDLMEERGGRWAIRRRTVVDEWDRVDPVRGRIPGHEQFHRGRRSRDDLVYRLRELGPPSQPL